MSGEVAAIRRPHRHRRELRPSILDLFGLPDGSRAVSRRPIVPRSPATTRWWRGSCRAAERQAATAAICSRCCSRRATPRPASGMSDRQLRDEILTIFLAGHETTANALSWTWYLLARHPEAEARLHEELDRVLGGRMSDLRRPCRAQMDSHGDRGDAAPLPAGAHHRADGDRRGPHRRRCASRRAHRSPSAST